MVSFLAWVEGAARVGRGHTDGMAGGEGVSERMYGKSTGW